MFSVNTVPLLFINLAGEMLYVLNHRLESQRIPKAKGIKVNTDIVSIMLHERILNQLFKPQSIYNRQALRKLFEDLAHASIMRLDTESMNKLYDLMIMVVKYQVLLAREPSELLLITLNHLDGIRNYVSRTDILRQIDTARLTVTQKYKHLTLGELQSIRYSLLNILSGYHVRVSVFLRDNTQNSDGTFVMPINGCIPKGCEIPGVVRMFRGDGQISEVKQFPTEGSYELPLYDGCLELQSRYTKLGCNIYKPHQNEELHHPVWNNKNNELLTNPENERSSTAMGETESVHLGITELNLLMSQLLRKPSDKFSDSLDNDTIQLNLCYINTKQNTEIKHCELEMNTTLYIDARNQNSSVFQKVIGEMETKEMGLTHTMNNENKDLVDLLDGFSE